MGENNKSKNKVIIVSIIIVISLAIIGLGVSIYLNSKNKSKNEENSSTNEEYDIESNRNLQNEIIALNATYTDAVAWLKIPDTSIDAPVFKGLTNEDYFAKDRDGGEKK